MRACRFLPALLALALAFPAIAPAQAAVFAPETYTLANGLRLIVVPNRLSPAVAQMVWYRVGAADEAPGASGLAHYLEHLLFRGTETLPPGAFSRLIAAQGGRDNAFTSYDFTATHEIVAADRLAMVMQMEADRMRHLRITEDTAAPELSVVLNERDERTDNDPQGRFHEKMRAALFPGHPYGIPVIGWREEVARLTPTDARAFYRLHYAPNNAVVVVSGPVTGAEVARLAAATFGRLEPAALPDRAPLPLPPLPATPEIVMKDAEIRQPRVEINAVAPSAPQDGPESLALEILAETLGADDVGLLHQALVMKEGVASGVSVRYESASRGPSVFGIAATPRPGGDVQALAERVKAWLRESARKGLPPRAIRAAQERMVRAAVFARDSLLAPGYAFGMALTVGLEENDVESWPGAVRAIRPAQVNAALRRLAGNPRVVTGFLVPDPDAAARAPAPPRRASLAPDGHRHDGDAR